MRKGTMRILIVLAVALLLPAILFAAGEKESTAKDNFKVALLLDGNIADGGWNGLPYAGLMKAKTDFGIEVSYTEQIPKEDINSVILDYAERGFNLIIANGYPFADAIQAISQDFPKSMFIGLNMPKAGPNLATARITYGIDGYLAGYLMGKMTKTKKVGFIAAVESPQMETDKRNMLKALGSIDPGIELKSVYTGSWSDISLAREGAASLADSGCDIILNNIDGATGAVAKLAQDRGIYAVGWSGDETHLNPDTILGSCLIRNDIVAYSAIQSALNGKYTPGKSLQFGLDTGALGYGEFGKMISADLKRECLAVQQSIKDGSLKLDTSVSGWD